jgi:hypothetical protein
VLMVNSLSNEYLKDWMPQVDVEALLGPPDRRSSRHSGYYVGSTYSWVGSHGWGHYYRVFNIPYDPKGTISGRGFISYSLKEKARAAASP